MTPLTAAIQPLNAPMLNNIAGCALIEPHSTEKELRFAATAGGSDTIAGIEDAWDQYALKAGILDRYLERYIESPVRVNAAEYRGAALMSGFIFTTTPEDEDWTLGVPATAYAMPMPLWNAGTHWPAWMSPHQQVNVDPLASYQLARHEAERARQGALSEIRRRLDRARAANLQQSPRQAVIKLTDQLGIGQLVAARAVRVTPTAVRKWRRGEPCRPEHRDRLAQLTALFELLSEGGPHDPASWIDIPISRESTLTPLDLFIAGRADLVVLHAAGANDPHETLDAFTPSWRSTFAPDGEYEVVKLADGSRSVVPRREVGG